MLLETGGEIGRSVEPDHIADFRHTVTPVLQQAASLTEPDFVNESQGGISRD